MYSEEPHESKEKTVENGVDDTLKEWISQEVRDSKTSVQQDKSHDGLEFQHTLTPFLSKSHFEIEC